MLRSKKSARESRRTIILVLLLLAFVNVQVLFYLLTGFVFFTSSIALYLILALLFYYPLVFILKKYFPIKKALVVNFRISLFTFFILLMLLDIGLMFTRFNASYHENRFYFYRSPYINYHKSWYHVWRKDHQLKSSEYNFHRSVNGIGISDTSALPDEADTMQRILCLGDSFTEGDGAPADSSWPSILQSLLRNDEKYRNVKVVNAGICGSDPWFQFFLLRDRLMVYKPEMVIQAINFSDVYDMIIRGGVSRFRDDSTVKYNSAPWWEWFYGSSRLFRIFIHRYAGINEYLMPGESLLIDKLRAMRQIRLACTHTGRLLDNKGIRYVIVFHPLKSEVEKKWFPLKLLVEHLKKHTSYKIINLYDLFVVAGMNEQNIYRYYWKTDGHHKAAGYSLFAEQIFLKIKDDHESNAPVIKQ